MGPECAVCKQKIPEALSLYQGALEILPNSVEVKTNIELLIEQSQQKKKSSDSPKEEGKEGEEKPDPKREDPEKQDKEGPIQNGKGTTSCLSES